WLFAKSITSSANLNASYGLGRAVAYAGWYLSIPVAGVVIWFLRRRHGATSLAGFLTEKHGRLATLAFLLVVLFRLMNEVWSNTAVVGAYFGAAGSAPYFVAALVFAALTLFYSLRGGLRSSIFTDAIQFGLGVFLLVFVLALVVPRAGARELLSTGEWTLRGGVDLLIVGLLQSFSYPFHDPVLTDRAFLTRPDRMLKGYLLAGLIAAAFIVLFGVTGMYARVAELPAGQDAPLRVANAFGLGTLGLMTVLMMVSAGSTLDSTLASFSRAVVVDVGGRSSDGPRDRGGFGALSDWLGRLDPVRTGRLAMLIAVLLGSFPLFAGTAIIKATTVSGTMVLGLAPVFLLFGWMRAGSAAFHLAFWPGVAVGVLVAIGAVPTSWSVGDGPYASLLGANLIGTGVVFAGYAVGAWVDGLATRRRLAAATGAAIAVLLLATPSARAADEAPSLRFSGQTMLRATFRRAHPDRPSYEVYNVRLVGTYDANPFRYVAELRFRQTPLRSYSPSNVWLQQAYVAWQSPVEGLRVSTGLLYDQLGLFWDSSWFGNLPYLNGHKLDPDMNLEVAWARQPGDGTFGWEAWVQLGLAEDGLNGSFVPAGKAGRLELPADLEADTDFREGPSVRARVVPVIAAGAFALRPGASVQRSTYDRASTGETGHQLVRGAELTVAGAGPIAGWQAFGEILAETVAGFTASDLDRDYWLAGFEGPVLERAAEYFPLVKIGASFQHTSYTNEDFGEDFVTARVFAKLVSAVGTTVEYVRWKVEGEDSPVVERVEAILHVWY
ncbi:MAG: hypothetical protein KC591_13795, partial [Gemmatimonadetes bacterium]|nr:hypothetical protein [Gemmatimonadota bacterium]